MLGVFFWWGELDISIPCVLIFLLICCFSNCRVTFSWCPSGRGDLRNELLPLCIFLFSSYASAASSFAIFRHFHAGVLCVSALQGLFVGLLCTLKNSVHFVSCFFLILALGSFPFCPGWLAGLGPLLNVIRGTWPLFGSMFWWWRAVGCYIEAWSEVTQNFWIPTSRIPLWCFIPLMQPWLGVLRNASQSPLW